MVASGLNLCGGTALAHGSERAALQIVHREPLDSSACGVAIESPLARPGREDCLLAATVDADGAEGFHRLSW